MAAQRKRARRLRRIANGLFLSLAALLITGCVLEAVIRWTGAAYDPQYDRRGTPKVVRSEDPEIRYELPANYDGLMLGGKVRTNGFGMRGKEVSLEKPANTFRIAVLGDSWAFGWGVDQGEEFPAVLEEMLAGVEAPGGIDFQVLNFSVWAYNTVQELAVLKRKAVRFSPDLVVVAYNLNDVEGLEGGKAGEKPRTDILRRLEQILARHSHLARFVDDRLRRLALRFQLEREDKIEGYRALYRPDAEAWKRVRDALREIRNEAESIGARCYLVHCPWLHILTDENPYRSIHRQVVDTAESMGIPTLDLFESFKGRDAAALRISPLDGHPRAEGHRIAAEAILQDLLRRRLLPLQGAGTLEAAGAGRGRR